MHKRVVAILLVIVPLIVACSSALAPTPTDTLPSPTATTPAPTPAATMLPMEIQDTSMSKNIINTPVVTIRYINRSAATVDSVEFLICPVNRFGEGLPRFGIGSRCMTGVSNAFVPPFNPGPPDYMYPASSRWTLSGFDTATKAVVLLSRVHFVDGRVWP